MIDDPTLHPKVMKAVWVGCGFDFRRIVPEVEAERARREYTRTHDARERKRLAAENNASIERLRADGAARPRRWR